MTQETHHLNEEITALYRCALADFVQRRAALAKQLRADKRPEDAERVKALRKPSRSAWALDNALAEDPGIIDRLAAAVRNAQEAQAGGALQLRAALDNVRAAARDVAHAAARAAIRGGVPVEATALVSAVNAVIGDAGAFAELQAGHLSEIPEAGGLDFLTAVALPAAPPEALLEESAAPPDFVDAAATARAELAAAEAALLDARTRAQSAEHSVADAADRLAAADAQLQRATREADARRAELARAQQTAEATAVQVRQAEQHVAELRARSNQLLKP